MKLAVSMLAAAALSATLASHAAADTVNAVLSAQYFEVAQGTDTDFSGTSGFTGSTPVVADGSTLGPDGLPQGSGVNDISNGEITWWSPSLNSNVSQTGSGFVSLPYASNMFAPNSTGNNDSSFYETAIFKGDFTLTSPSTVSFDLGSDDDSFIYVDGTLFGQNPGIHGVTYTDFTSPTLGTGPHQIEIFYADREQTAAYLQLNLDATSSGIVVTPPSAAPEPSAWLLMVAGIGGIGMMLRRARRKLGLGSDAFLTA